MTRRSNTMQEIPIEVLGRGVASLLSLQCTGTSKIASPILFTCNFEGFACVPRTEHQSSLYQLVLFAV